MITGYILSLIYGLLALVISAFPTGGGFPTIFFTAAATFGSFMYGWNLILPINELIDIMLTTGFLLISIFGIRVGLYGISVVRGNSMPGQS